MADNNIVIQVELQGQKTNKTFSKFEKVISNQKYRGRIYMIMVGNYEETKAFEGYFKKKNIFYQRLVNYMDLRITVFRF